MKTLPGWFLVWCLLLPLVSQAQSVPRFARHEITLEASGRYANPYVDCSAEATLTEPDGRATRTLPLFWDGGQTWTLRFAPDKPGSWKWTVTSADAGLNGRSGQFACVASKLRGSIQPMAGASRHFQYQNGERMWFLGDTAWALVTDDAREQHNRAAMERYLRNRAAQGFNVVHFMMLNEAGWPNNGGPPWSDIATERINPAYFREADQRMAFANAQGIVLGIAVAWGDKRRNERWPWNRLPNLDARQRYARYVAARYGAYDVYFIVSGEWHAEIRARSATEPDIRREFVAIGDALQAVNVHDRMMTIHPMTAHGSTHEFNMAATWMDFADYQQNYADLHARALKPRTVAKPVVNSEYAYYLRDQNGDGIVDKNHSYTVDDIRNASWDLVMAGAYLVNGFGSTYMGGNRHPTPFLPDDPKNVIWAEQIGHVKAFFSRLDYWKLEPHDELVTCATPRGEDRKGTSGGEGRGATTLRAPATTYWCLAEPGRTYAVYVRGTKEPVTLTLSGGDTAAASWKAERFDPRTGKASAVSARPASGTLSLTTPDEQDWVFVVRRG